MLRPLLICCAICLSESLIAANNQTKIVQSSQQAIYESQLECQNLLTTGTFQECWLTLNHAGKAIENTEIFIDGGMPMHAHGLPTSPKITWSKDKRAHLIHGLKFSMPGQWNLIFKVNHSDDSLKDKIVIPIEVK